MSQEVINHREIVAELGNLKKQLEQFLVISEDDFLNIGSKLRDYQNFSNKVNNHSQNIVEVIGNEILTAGMDKLSSLFGKIGQHFVEASETIEKDKIDLKEIYDKLSHIEGSLTGFDKIVKTLRMLGIAAKIESARLNLVDSGFYLLAETVDKMSSQIGDRKNLIKDKSNKLLDHLLKSLNELQNLAIDQEKQNRTFDESTKNSLEKFKQKNLVCANAIGEIKFIGTKLTDYLMNIVQTIQIHDIARQQLQHVNESLDEMIESANGIDNENEEDIEIYSFIHDNLELQSRQLKGTLENFTKSVYSIIQNLREVESGAEDIFGESRKIIGSDSKSENLHQSMIKDNLEFIKTGLEENIIIDKNLDNSIVEIVTIVNDLAKQIDIIEEIGTEIELVALNAQIKAAHLGKEGASLGVLAEAIQKLSFEAKGQTEQTFKVLMTIDSLSSALRSEVSSSRQQTTSKLLETTIEELNLLVNSIKNVEVGAMNETKELESIIKLFKSELKSTVNNINIHTAAEQILGEVIFGFDQIADNLKQQYNIQSHRDLNTKRNISKYTMMSEREIHTDYTHKSNNQNNLLSLPQPDNDGLDDNIELF